MRTPTPPHLLPVLALTACLLRAPAAAASRPVPLAEGGKTDYVLVGTTGEPDIELALEELAHHLRAATGAEFRTLTVAEAGELSRRIVVGDNALSRSLLGETAVASLEPQESLVAVKGRDVVTGLPKTIDISSEEVRDALAEPMASLVERVRGVLERTPPELAADIIEQGITLTGGGALLQGLDRLIESQTDVPVRLAEDPLTCVAVGTGLYLELAESLPAGLLATSTEASSGYTR